MRVAQFAVALRGCMINPFAGESFVITAFGGRIAVEAIETCGIGNQNHGFLATAQY